MVDIVEEKKEKGPGKENQEAGAEAENEEDARGVTTDVLGIVNLDQVA